MATLILSVSLNFIIACKNDKWYNKQSFDLAFHFSFNQNKLWTNWRSKGLFYPTNPVFYTGQSVWWKPMFFPNGMFGNLWLLLTHKPVGLLTCDILEVHGRFYWPGPSGLWLNSKTGNVWFSLRFFINWHTANRWHSIMWHGMQNHFNSVISYYGVHYLPLTQIWIKFVNLACIGHCMVFSWTCTMSVSCFQRKHSDSYIAKKR
jgi:hypothetical protein